MKNQLSQKYGVRKWQDNIEHQNLSPYQVDEANSTTTYIRYESGDDEVFVKRITVVGNITTVEYSYTTWALRASAVYQSINE